MAYLSAAVQADIIANPERISAVYASARAPFVQQMGAGFSAQCEDHIRLAFCSLVAWDLKPYQGSLTHTLRGLMAAPGLDCDNYVSLAWHLFYLMRPLSNTQVAAVGWNGGAVGNHAQMQAITPGSPDIYLDPTIGLAVTGCSIDALCKGFKFQPQHIASWASFNDRPEVTQLRSKVLAAVQSGTYDVSDLLFFTLGIDKWLQLAGKTDWKSQQTPQAHQIP